MSRMTDKMVGFGMVQMCGGGRCPRAFLTEDGDLIIQGILVDPNLRVQLDPLGNEEVVRLPKELVRELFQNYQAS